MEETGLRKTAPTQPPTKKENKTKTSQEPSIQLYGSGKDAGRTREGRGKDAVRILK